MVNLNLGSLESASMSFVPALVLTASLLPAHRQRRVFSRIMASRSFGGCLRTGVIGRKWRNSRLTGVICFRVEPRRPIRVVSTIRRSETIEGLGRRWRRPPLARRRQRPFYMMGDAMISVKISTEGGEIKAARGSICLPRPG